MFLMPEDVVKLLLAILIGGVIGAEREFRDKAAGFRTIIFICVGATLFTIFSKKLGGDDDPVRIAANIVSGVGFLGAGAILRGPGGVMGLTTAATIWLAAALGMGIGGGHFAVSGAGAVAILIVLWVFPKIEGWIDHVRDARTYEIVTPVNLEKFDELQATFLECGLRTRRPRRIKSGADMICTWHAQGSPECHEKLVAKLFADPDVKQFKT